MEGRVGKVVVVEVGGSEEEEEEEVQVVHTSPGQKGQ